MEKTADDRCDTGLPGIAPVEAPVIGVSVPEPTRSAADAPAIPRRIGSLAVASAGYAMVIPWG